MERFERSFSTITFVKAFLQGDYGRAEAMGVHVTAADQARAIPMLPFLIGRVLVVRALSRVPVVERATEREYVVRTAGEAAALGTGTRSTPPGSAEVARRAPEPQDGQRPVVRNSSITRVCGSRSKPWSASHCSS